MTRKMIINIVFNIDPKWPRNPYKYARLTKEWIDYRMDIFMKYTCRSLKNQTNQNFICFIAYDKESETLIKSALGRYEKLPNNIRFTTDMKSDTINEIKKGCDYVYMIRLDSDNMYHPDFIKKLFAIDVSSDTKAILCQNGYVYNVPTNEIAEFYRESPSFYVLLYKPEDYINEKYYKIKGGHMGVIDLNPTILDGYNFVVVVHESNVSNNFKKTFYQRLIVDDKEKTQIFKNLKM